jgi:hypothetical protein
MNRRVVITGMYGLTEVEADFPLREASAHTRRLRVGLEGNCCSLVIGKVNVN